MTKTINRAVICPNCKAEVEVRSGFAHMTLTRHLKTCQSKQLLEPSVTSVGQEYLTGSAICTSPPLRRGYARNVGMLKMIVIKKLTCLFFGHCYFSLENMSAYLCAECGKEKYVGYDKDKK